MFFRHNKQHLYTYISIYDREDIWHTGTNESSSNVARRRCQQTEQNPNKRERHCAVDGVN